MNLRPPGPQPGALPDCATPRDGHSLPPDSVRALCEHVFVEALRRCGRCGEHKPVEQFAWRRRAKGQRHSYCRPCSSAYHREHYLANKQRYVDQARATRDALRLRRGDLILNYLRDHPCADCGEDDPVVLEFDHLRDKKFDISRGYIDVALDKLLAEIAKCEVVCANCHRRRTVARRPTIRSLLLLADEQI